MPVKSIRKDDVNVTAKQLGVKEGDKFVVLTPAESHCYEEHNSEFSIGDVITLVEDDNTYCPSFERGDGTLAFESFSCLARYEEPCENVPSTQETEQKQQSIKILETSYDVEYMEQTESVSRFKIEGLTPEQYVSIINYINTL